MKIWYIHRIKYKIGGLKLIYILILFIIGEIFLTMYAFKIRLCISACHTNNLDNCKYDTKFLVIIPVHNEELQIEDVIKSIRKSNYPQRLIDIIILNDRCSDATVEIAYKNKVKVYNILNKKNTKGAILKSFCSQYKEIINKFDYLCIADADNIFDEYFFEFGHKELKKGNKIVQGQISNIQYKKNAISFFMTSFQQIITSFMFYQNKLGKSVIIAGKGVLIAPQVIEQIEWNENSLVEDVSFSFDALLKSYKIHYCHQMKVKTKHPYTILDLWIQQRRWTSGQIQIIKKYHSNIFDKNLNGIAKSFVFLGYTNIALFCLMTISLFNPKVYLLILISLYLCVFITNLIIIKRENTNYIKGILIFPFILFYWHLIFITSFFRSEKEWKQIKNKY